MINIFFQQLQFFTLTLIGQNYSQMKQHLLKLFWMQSSYMKNSIIKGFAFCNILINQIQQKYQHTSIDMKRQFTYPYDQVNNDQNLLYGRGIYKSPTYYQQKGPKVSANQSRFDNYPQQGQKPQQYKCSQAPDNRARCRNCMVCWITCMNFISSTLFCIGMCSRFAGGC